MNDEKCISTQLSLFSSESHEDAKLANEKSKKKKQRVGNPNEQTSRIVDFVSTSSNMSDNRYGEYVVHGDYMVPYTCDTREMKLERLHPMPRDKCAVMDPIPHKYYVCGLPFNGSATGFIHSFSDHFDSYKGAHMKVNGRRWTSDLQQEEYASLVRFDDPKCRATMLQLVKYWNAQGKKASDSGTDGHNQIELKLNEEPYHENAPGFAHYLEYEKEWVPRKGYVPWRTELVVFSQKWQMVGTLDMLYKNPKTGNLIISDWKFTRELVSKHEKASAPNNRFRKSMTYPFEDVFQTKLNQYFLQLNLYATIMKEEGYLEPDQTIEAMYIVVFHHTLEKYQVIQVPCMQDAMRKALDARALYLKSPANRIADKYGFVTQVVLSESNDSKCTHEPDISELVATRKSYSFVNWRHKEDDVEWMKSTEPIPEHDAYKSFVFQCSHCDLAVCYKKKHD